MNGPLSYMLYGTNGPWGDYFIHSDDLEALKIEALSRLKHGYTATIRNNVTGEEKDLQLKSK